MQAMSLTEEETEEVIKLQKLSKQYEGLIRTSRNPEQLKRSKIELKKIVDRLEELCPDGVPDNLGAPQQKSLSDAEKLQQYELLSQFSVEKASPNCDDKDVNMLSTILKVWEAEFAPANSDSHVKLEFSLSAERDSHYAILENMKRSLKTLVETIEDFHRATRDDFKAQLRDMKSRYTRHYLSEGMAFLKRLREFWKKIDDDIASGGQSCLNKEDDVRFNRKFEEATFFEGYTVAKVVSSSNLFLNEAIDSLNLPDIARKPL